MKKYPIMNFKSPAVYLYFFLFMAISAFSVLIIIKSNNFWIDELFIIPILMALVFLIYSLTGKVVVEGTCITKKTLLGTRLLKIHEIKSFGVMKQEGELGIRIIEESEFNTIDWIFPKTIFISKDKDYNPLAYNQKNTIKFHYQKDLYQDVLQKIIACK